MIKLNDDEYVQEEIKSLIRQMFKTRHWDQGYIPQFFLGAENMLYYLMEEPEEITRFLKVAEHAKGEKGSEAMKVEIKAVKMSNTVSTKYPISTVVVTLDGPANDVLAILTMLKASGYEIE